MTELLVRLFISNKDEVQDSKVRTAYGVLASIVGICLNIVLFAVKLTAGLLLNSISVMADAFNNLSDAASSVISFVGVKLAGRPADAEHPFGHGRYEYIAALAVSFLVLQVGLSCLKSAVGKIFRPERVEFQPVIILVLAVTILLKLWLAFFNRKLGRRINSKVMQATAADATGDVLVTGATVLSLIIGKYSGLAVDGYMGAVVSVVVVAAGIGIAKDTLKPLLGEAVTPEVYELLTKKVESYDGILGTHDLIVHNYGPTHSMATIHAEVPNDVGIETAHALIDRIERETLHDLDIFLVIHMDPVEVRDKAVGACKLRVAELVCELEPAASIHDFRMVKGEKRITLIFDLVVPYSYEPESERELLERVSARLEQEDPRYECVINIENSFVRAEN
ncbi:MAG: cation diffusion facilitator family transporter [Lachnospiraceae bacterium]|nr:cation diffusion facilitator family transporter [Lachnospiraceae bacterium]